MTIGVKQSDRGDIEASAAAWILRREEGAFSQDDRTALETWLAADSRHRTAYLQLNEAWKFSAGLKTWRPLDAPMDPDLLLARPARLHPARRLPFALAAVAASIFVAAWMWLKLSDSSYSTPIGGYQRIVLEDGSALQLNTDSKVRVRFSENRRAVHLLRGEAYFDVVRDPSRPFDVAAGDTVVRAVGTAFAVRLREAQRVEVIVTQGRVLLREENAVLPVENPTTARAEAGQTAESRPTGLRVKRMRKEEIDRRLAWQTGQLHFRKEPLAVVVAEFNRYNRRRVEIVDPALSSLEVHGNFKATDLDSFVAAMQNALDIRVETTQETIRLFAE
jgi:transmembrane sensor